MTRDWEHLNAQQLIDKAVELGVTLVQICVRPALHEMDRDDLAELHGYASGKGVRIEVGTTGSDPEQLLRYLQIAKTLKAPLVRTIFPQASPGLSRERSRLTEVAAEYEREKVHLAIENHEMYGYRELIELLETLATPHVGVCLDTVNSLGRGEGVEEVTQALLPFTVCLHVKDYTVVRGDTDMGFTVVGAPAGEGKLDIPDQLSRLKEANPEASVVLEQWTPFADTIEQTIRLQEQWAKQGIGYLKNVWEELQL
jgi:sugar phosphate isomerase/epimerase